MRVFISSTAIFTKLRKYPSRMYIYMCVCVCVCVYV